MRLLRIHLTAGACLLLPFFFAGCMRLSDGRPPGPWHEAYQPINQEEPRVFVVQGLAQAVDVFGEPVVAVNKVLLRRSRRTEAARRYRIGEDFSLTQCIDTTNGVFAVYIGEDIDHRNFYPLLAHECAHLINPWITDWYMEGMATVFSEQLCAEAGRMWGDWARHFERSRRDPYARSYRMMQALQAAFPGQYSDIIHHVRSNGREEPWLQIDIDAWLDTLPEERRQAALDIIAPHISVLSRNVAGHYTFAVPKELAD